MTDGCELEGNEQLQISKSEIKFKLLELKYGKQFCTFTKSSVEVSESLIAAWCQILGWSLAGGGCSDAGSEAVRGWWWPPIMWPGSASVSSRTSVQPQQPGSLLAAVASRWLYKCYVIPSSCETEILTTRQIQTLQIYLIKNNIR